jgi:hypothetical protein
MGLVGGFGKSPGEILLLMILLMGLGSLRAMGVGLGMGMLLGGMGGMSFMGGLLMATLKSSVGVWGMILPAVVQVGVAVEQGRGVVKMGAGFGNGIAVV